MGIGGRVRFGQLPRERFEALLSFDDMTEGQ